MISQYWTGQIPARPLSINVRDTVGREFNATAYTDIDVEMLDPHNNDVDLSGGVLQTAGAGAGRFVFEWPKDRSLFDKPGDYVLHLVLSADDGAKDITTQHTIRVREFGGSK